jgi:hypothetical protein
VATTPAATTAAELGLGRLVGVLDPPGGAGVLALHPDRGHTLLEVAGLVDHEHRIGVPETGDDVVTQVVAHPVGVPHRPVE